MKIIGSYSYFFVEILLILWKCHPSHAASRRSGFARGRRWNCYSFVRYLAERGQRRLNLRFIAHRDDRQLRDVDIFVRHASHICCRHLFYARLVLLECVGGIAVEGERYLFAESLVG